MATQCFEGDENSHSSQLGTTSVVIGAITGAVGEDAVNEEMVDDEETFTGAVVVTDVVRLAWAAWWQPALMLYCICKYFLSSYFLAPTVPPF